MVFYESILNQNTNIFEGPEVSEKVIPPKKPPTKVVPRKEPPAKGILWQNDTHNCVPWLLHKSVFDLVLYFVFCLRGVSK